LKHAGKYTLVPQPTNDPNDPLNWSRTWKWLTMSSMALCTFNYGVGPLSLAPQVPYYMKDFDSSLPAVINFVGVSILILGFTNFIWVPLSRGLGRRPVAIITTLITMASGIWRARATSYNSFLGASILCGIGASPGETLGPIVIADISFLHERGRWMGLYQWSFWSGLMVRYASEPYLYGELTKDRSDRSWLASLLKIMVGRASGGSVPPYQPLPSYGSRSSFPKRSGTDEALPSRASTRKPRPADHP